MEPRILLFIIFGAAIGAVYWLENRLKGTFLSVPIIYVAIGWFLFSLPLDLGWLNPAFNVEETIAIEHLSEFIVIVSLVSLGLAIDRRVSWRGWKQVLPLLLVTIPLPIPCTAWLGSWVMGLPLASALLLGACLSPTDPVLARAVQVSPPGQSGRDDVRFNLSAEAGFNDSLAFPFYYLAYGQHHAEFSHLPELWSAVSFTVLLSIVIHGITASKFLGALDKNQRIAKP